MARAICMAESGCQPGAIYHNTDGSIDRGEFQINSIHAGLVNGDVSRLLDPTINIRVAAQLYHAQGWWPWTTYRTGAYRKFLK